MGCHCTVNAGVVVGIKTTIDTRPTIGDNVDLCIGAKIIGNIHIGSGSVVAPNSVVITNVNDFEVVSGVPAKVIKRINENFCH